MLERARDRLPQVSTNKILLMCVVKVVFTVLLSLSAQTAKHYFTALPCRTPVASCKHNLLIIVIEENVLLNIHKMRLLRLFSLHEAGSTPA